MCASPRYSKTRRGLPGRLAPSPDLFISGWALSQAGMPEPLLGVLPSLPGPGGATSHRGAGIGADGAGGPVGGGRQRADEL